MGTEGSRRVWHGLALLAAALTVSTWGPGGTQAAPTVQGVTEARGSGPAGPTGPPGVAVGANPYGAAGGLAPTPTATIPPAPFSAQASGSQAPFVPLAYDPPGVAPASANPVLASTVVLVPPGAVVATMTQTPLVPAPGQPAQPGLSRAAPPPVGGLPPGAGPGGPGGPAASAGSAVQPLPQTLPSTAAGQAPAVPFVPGVGPLQALPSPIPTATSTPTATLTPTATSTPTPTSTVTPTPTATPSIRAPMNLRMASAGPAGGMYTIAWDPANVESVMEYRVYGVGAGGDMRRLYTIPGSASQAVLHALDPSIGFSLVLVAVDTRGRESAPSNSVHTAGAPTATPPVPAYAGASGYSGAPAPPPPGGAPPGPPGPGGAGSPYGPVGPGATGSAAPPSLYAPSGIAGQPIPPTPPLPYQAPVVPPLPVGPRPVR